GVPSAWVLLCVRAFGKPFLEPRQGDGIATVEKLTHFFGLLIITEAEANFPDPGRFLPLGLEIDDGPHFFNGVREGKSLRSLGDPEGQHAAGFEAKNRI